jgi:biotin transport system substrate-specific component
MSSHIPALGIANDRATTKVFWAFTFAVLTAVGAQVEIPHYPVPFTLQTLFVLLAGGFLGARAGAASMMMYLLMGLVGLPVFSGAGAGLARLLGPTGGFLLGFPVAAFVIGSLMSRESELWWTVVSLTAGLVIIFILGTVQLNVVLIHDWTSAIGSGFLLFSWWDAVKLAAATGILTAWRNHRMA